MADAGGLQKLGPSKKVVGEYSRSGNGVKLVKQNFSFLLQDVIVPTAPWGTAGGEADSMLSKALSPDQGAGERGATWIHTDSILPEHHGAPCPILCLRL